MFEYHSNYCVLIILSDFIELIFMANELLKANRLGTHKSKKKKIIPEKH